MILGTQRYISLLKFEPGVLCDEIDISQCKFMNLFSQELLFPMFAYSHIKTKQMNNHSQQLSSIRFWREKILIRTLVVNKRDRKEKPFYEIDQNNARPTAIVRIKIENLLFIVPHQFT